MDNVIINTSKILFYNLTIFNIFHLCLIKWKTPLSKSPFRQSFKSSRKLQLTTIATSTSLSLLENLSTLKLGNIWKFSKTLKLQTSLKAISYPTNTRPFLIVRKKILSIFFLKFIDLMSIHYSHMEEKWLLGFKLSKLEIQLMYKDLSENLTINLEDSLSPITSQQLLRESSLSQEVAELLHAIKSFNKSSIWKMKMLNWFFYSRTKRNKISYWERNFKTFSRDLSFTSF